MTYASTKTNRLVDGWGFALLATFLALFLTHLISPSESTTAYVLFYGAIIFSAWYGGLGPAILTAGLSMTAIDYFFIPPPNAFNLEIPDLLRVVIFGAVSIVTGFLTIRPAKNALGKVLPLGRSIAVSVPDSRKVVACRLLGHILIAAVLLTNEWTLSSFLGLPNRPVQIMHRTETLVLCALILAIGVFLTWFSHKKFSVNLAILICSIAACAIGFEIFSRWHRTYWTTMMIQPFRTADPALHHTLLKNASGGEKWRGRSIAYKTNSLGFRDREIRDVAKVKQGGKRILFLGDSFTEGFGVSYEDSFIGQLNRLGREKGLDIEILNAGTVSLSPSLHYKKLKRFLNDGFTTDQVVLMLDTSDVYDEAIAYLNWNAGKQTRRIDIYPRLFAAIENSWSCWRVLHSKSFMLDAEKALWTESPEIYEAWGHRGVQICQENILKIARLCRDRSIRFDLVIYPWPMQLQMQWQGRHHSSLSQIPFRDFAAANGIAFHDLYPDFFALNDWKPLFFTGDCHWNERGHAFVADSLVKNIFSGKSLRFYRPKTPVTTFPSE